MPTYTALPLDGLTHKEQQQAIFNRVVAHLRAQGKPAHDNSGNCVYRTVTGNACAVGCLIPDAEYDACIEAKGVRSLNTAVTHYNIERGTVHFDAQAMMQRLNLAEHIPGLLETLQSAHDAWGAEDFAPQSYAWRDQEKASFLKVAKHFKLNTAVLD